MPDVFAAGRWWRADALEELAHGWRAETLAHISGETRFLAAAPPTTPVGVALFAALSSLPLPLILIAADHVVWPALGLLPPRTTFMLLRSQAALTTKVDRMGCTAAVLPDAGPRANSGEVNLLQSPGVVTFTSGSTGAPKPVFRSIDAIAGAAGARLAALHVPPGSGIVAGASLAHGRGLTCLVSAMLLGGPIGLLDPVNHRAALAALALPEFTAWWATAPLVDVLGRCALSGPARIPPVCLLSSPISRQVFDAFADRFGVPVRQTYSSTETGALSVDSAPAADVRPETVGHMVAGVELRIGDHPATPLPSGEAGRIWVRSAWRMAGYGFPPDVDRSEDVENWWPTRDLGSFDREGRLLLAGRLDDCIRTREGQLVNLADIARQLRELNGVGEVAVVPVDGQAGSSFGAVLECEVSIPLQALRIRISDALPSWARPRKLAVVTSLPRLPNGKPDRLACIAALDAKP